MAEDDRLTWVGELPVPITNVQIHFETYVVEQWLRRIALAALMAKGGSRWSDVVPREIVPEAKKQLNLLHRRTFLDPENSDNLVWALTLDQLRQVLTAEDLSSFVFELTGLSRRDLTGDLQTLREIRNIVAHHRATNNMALETFRLVARRMDGAIRRFKLKLIYSESLEVLHGASNRPKNDLAELFESSGLAPERWFLLYDRGRFHDFSVVYGDPVLVGGFVDVGNLLDLFHDIRHAVLCIVLPHATSEGYEGKLSVVWPKDVTSG